MKRKKTTYLLIIAVLIIWGLVIYNLVSFGKQDDLKVNTIEIGKQTLNLEKRETIVLEINDRDPFLGVVKKENPKRLIKTNRLKINPIPVQTLWPEIKYKGLISDDKDNDKVFMIIVNGKTYLLRKGAKVDDLLFTNGNHKAITILYKKETKTFPINQ